MGRWDERTAGTLPAVGWLALLGVAAVPLAIGFPGESRLLWDNISLPKSVALIVLSALAIGAWGAAVATRRARLRRHVSLYVAVAAGVWAVVAATMSVSPAVSVFGDYMRTSGLLTFLASVAVFVALVQYVETPARMRALAGAIVAAGAVVSLYALLQFAGVDPIPWGGASFGDRVFATLGNPDPLGAYLVVPAVLAAGLALEERGRIRRIGLWVLAAVMVAVVGVTLVRGAWVGLGVGGAALALVLFRMRRPGRRLLLGVGLALVLAAGVVLLSEAVPQNGLTVVERATSLVRWPPKGSVRQRLDIWQEALAAIGERPVTGWGQGTFQYAFSATRSEEWVLRNGGERVPDDAHSYPLQLAVTMGVPALLLVTAVFGSALWGGASIALWRAGPRDLEDGGQLRSRDGRVLYGAFWAASAASLAALATSLSLPFVSIWAWVCAGVLVAPLARSGTDGGRSRRAAAGALSVIALAISLLSASWIVADRAFAVAMREPDHVSRARGIERAIALNPLPQEYRVRRGLALGDAVTDAARAGENDRARRLLLLADAAFEQASEHAPWDIEAALELAHARTEFVRLFDERQAQAVDACERACEIAPNDPEAHRLMATAYLCAGDPTSALDEARCATALDETSVEGFLLLGDACVAAGQEGEARVAFEAVLELSSDEPYATEALAELEGRNP